MNTYIALLRGINVSGHKMIKMEALRTVLATLPFTNISTYIQSGNIIFQTEHDEPQRIAHLIAQAIYKHFSFDVPVMVLTPLELKTAIDNNPFANVTVDDVQPYVAFFSEKPDSRNIAILSAYNFGKDKFVVMDAMMYLFYADSAGNTKLTNTIIESKLQVKATMRNWKTVNKLFLLAQEI